MQTELQRTMSQYDGGQTGDLERDLIQTARQAMQMRWEVDSLRADIIDLAAQGQDTFAVKTELGGKETRLKGLERKVNFLRQELFSRNPKKYHFLHR